MSPVTNEIAALEERLRLAELGPDPEFFEIFLADDAVIITEDGLPKIIKQKIVEAHRPGHNPKFTSVEMKDVVIHDHGSAAVVTCQGKFTGPDGEKTLKFMRVWVKKDGGWQIVAASTG